MIFNLITLPFRIILVVVIMSISALFWVFVAVLVYLIWKHIAHNFAKAVATEVKKDLAAH